MISLTYTFSLIFYRHSHAKKSLWINIWIFYAQQLFFNNKSPQAFKELDINFRVAFDSSNIHCVKAGAQAIWIRRRQDKNRAQDALSGLLACSVYLALHIFRHSFLKKLLKLFLLTLHTQAQHTRIFLDSTHIREEGHYTSTMDPRPQVLSSSSSKGSTSLLRKKKALEISLMHIEFSRFSFWHVVCAITGFYRSRINFLKGKARNFSQKASITLAQIPVHISKIIMFFCHIQYLIHAHRYNLNMISHKC